jgi:hypothetical protein
VPVRSDDSSPQATRRGSSNGTRKPDRIELGKRADLLVVGGTVADPYDALIRAKETDIRLVMINGIARYGGALVRARVTRRPSVRLIRSGGRLCCGASLAHRSDAVEPTCRPRQTGVRANRARWLQGVASS